MTIVAFIDKHRIHMTAVMVDKNPNIASMPEGSTHWKCVLRIGSRCMTTHFSRGPAICQEPTAAEVLSCLALEARTIENARSFEEWAQELGYDADSRAAESTFKACQRGAKKLRSLLGATFTECLSAEE